MEVENNIVKYIINNRKDIVATKLHVFSPTLQKSINNLIKNNRYVRYTVNVGKLFTNGGSSLGVLYEVFIKGQTQNGYKETNIFIKTIIPGDNLIMISITDVFSRELFAYEELFKIYKNLQKEFEIPTEDKFKMIESYEGSSMEAIILDNIEVHGFKAFNRMEVLPLKFAELTIQEIAKFHGLSFVVQEKYPRYFNAEIKTKHEPYTLDDEWKIFVEKITKITMSYLEESSRKRVERFIPRLIEKFPFYMGNSEATRSCLLHGDFKANNVLLREVEGEISEVLLIDYQLIYYGSPINDLLYFLFGATDQTFRKNYLDHLKNLYHITLAKYLHHFNINIDKVYPKEEYERDFKRRLEYGLMVALFIVPFFFARESDGEESPSDAALDPDERFRDRLRGIVDDFIDWGYL